MLLHFSLESVWFHLPSGLEAANGEGWGDHRDHIGIFKAFVGILLGYKDFCRDNGKEHGNYNLGLQV